MAIADILTKLFSGPTAQDNIAPDGRSMASPIQQYIDQMMPPVDQKTERRKAISRGLAEFAKSISSSNQPFLAALGQAAPAGAIGFLDAKDGGDEKTRARNKDVMMQMFGLAKNEDASQYKSDALASREEIARMRDQQFQDRLDEMARHNKVGEGLTGDKIDLNSDLGVNRLLEIIRHNKVGEGYAGDRSAQGWDRLGQGDRRLDQGDITLDLNGQKVVETNRHNTATEGQGDTRLDQNGQRIDLTGQIVDETVRHNKANEAKQPPRANPSIAEAGKNRRAALKQLNDYINGNAPTPEEAAAKKTEIFKDYGVDQPDTTQAQPVPAPMSGGNTSVAPPAMADRVIGQVYMSPKGPVIWTADGWVAAK